MLAGKGEDRHAVSRRAPIYAFMHLLVLGAFWCYERGVFQRND